MRLPRLWVHAWLSCAACSVLFFAHAHAYTISSAISDGCHERITTEALRSVREELANAAALPTSRNERALIDDLPFKVPADLRDIGGATLLVAVRDNDLKGHNSADLSQLALTHGNPHAQREHCLRGPDQEEPSGSEAAVLACRAFIRERIVLALAGLDQAGAPDPSKRTELKVYLALRHQVEAPLPSFYVHMGQALHTLEDSFTHTYRTADGMKITVVGDWLHQVAGDLSEERHGPGHRGELDECKDLDELRSLRRELATQAVTETLRTTLDPSLSQEQKLAAVDTILNKYLSYQPGCSHENGWCEAPEASYGDSKIVKCTLGSGAPDGALFLLLGLLVLRGRAREAARPPTRALWLLLVLSLPARLAYAEDKQAHGERAEAEGGPSSMEHRRKGTEHDGDELVFGGYAGGAGSVDHGALAVQLAARMRVRKNWIVGVDAEWNPWISDPRIYDIDNSRLGAFNLYGTGIFRLPLANEDFNLRASINLGCSTALFDLYGVPRGSTGLYGALSPLGLEWKIASVPYLIINPLSIVLAAPQLSGVPFVYAQYRFTIGIELYARK